MLFLLVFSLSLLTLTGPGTHSFTLPPGQFVFECYGGQGGSSHFNDDEKKTGGKGAYVKGTLDIIGDSKKFYAHVGGKGKAGVKGPNDGGNNGGGKGGEDTGNNIGDGNDASGGGGGASDIRYKNDNYYNRVMVAAGGSGAAWICEGAPGGDTKGYHATSNDNFVQDNKVNQDSDRITGEGEDGDSENGIPGSGAGGGWRGGYKGVALARGTDEKDSYKAVASSGSSYISGYTGCTKYGEISFTQRNMTKGFHEGAGKIVITVNFNCSQNCISCTSGTSCTKCKTGYLLQNNLCVSKCSTGYIKVGSNCNKCTSPCKTCSTSVTACLSCENNYFLSGTKCVKECPIGFYANKKTSKCEQCDKSCELCESDPTKCTKCPSNYTLYNNSCYTQCPSGTTKIGNSCQPCNSECKTCSSSSTKCTSCQPELFLHEEQCIEKCPPKFYENVDHCSDCKAPCETCDSKDHCITCVKGFNLFNGKCVIA